MGGISCGTCRKYNHETGECRARPPLKCVMNYDKEGMVFFSGEFVRTNPVDDWCFEYEAR